MALSRKLSEKKPTNRLFVNASVFRVDLTPLGLDEKLGGQKIKKEVIDIVAGVRRAEPRHYLDSGDVIAIPNKISDFDIINTCPQLRDLDIHTNHTITVCGMGFDIIPLDRLERFLFVQTGKRAPSQVREVLLNLITSLQVDPKAWTLD